MTRLRLILQLALSGIVTNKVRSLLTVLGIVIGIAAVITLLSLGTGAQADVLGSISSLGSNVITIAPRSITSGPGSTADNAQSLTLRDLDFLSNAARFPEVAAITPQTSLDRTVASGSLDTNAEINAVDVAIAEIQNLEVQQGRFLRAADVTAARNVAVVGPDIATELFPRLDQLEQALGMTVEIGGIRFTIVGVLAARGSSGFTNQDKEIYIPYTTAAARVFRSNNFAFIRFTVVDPERIDAAAIRVEERLAKFRNKSVDDADFLVFTSDDLLSTVGQVTGIFTALLASIAAISLIVGGIGISNIMLVSVTERTKEIGLRKAIGAQERDILFQFLFEAVFLTVLGGLIGIVLGVSLALIIGRLASISASITSESIILATSVSAAVGLVFGFFPAYKAAQLSPIDALRFE